MTADIELPPIAVSPYTDRILAAVRKQDCADPLFRILQDYARANVAHYIRQRDAVDPLAVLARAQKAEAEIEALRAEVEAVWAAMPRDARYLDPPDGGCVPLHEQVRRMAADATRAERLEKALRDLEVCANTIDGCYTRNPGNFAVALRELRESAERSRDALLRDQEVGNG